ncbi:MAG: hypothetical protein ACOYKZ_05875 [Chlamydiia bacterium]
MNVNQVQPPGQIQNHVAKLFDPDAFEQGTRDYQVGATLRRLIEIGATTDSTQLITWVVDELSDYLRYKFNRNTRALACRASLLELLKRAESPDGRPIMPLVLVAARLQHHCLCSWGCWKSEHLPRFDHETDQISMDVKQAFAERRDPEVDVEFATRLRRLLRHHLNGYATSRASPGFDTYCVNAETLSLNDQGKRAYTDAITQLVHWEILTKVRPTYSVGNNFSYCKHMVDWLNKSLEHSIRISKGLRNESNSVAEVCTVMQNFCAESLKPMTEGDMLLSGADWRDYKFSSVVLNEVGKKSDLALYQHIENKEDFLELPL